MGGLDQQEFRSATDWRPKQPTQFVVARSPTPSRLGGTRASLRLGLAPHIREAEGLIRQ